MKITNTTRLLIHLPTGKWEFLTEKEIKNKLCISDLEFKWHYMNSKDLGGYLILNIDSKALNSLVGGN